MVGRTVLYKLSAYDADAINRRRDDARAANAGRANSGYVVHTGNHVNAGDVFPALIVADWSHGTPGGAKNLQVLLDGNDTYWATSRIEGDGECQWTRLP